MGDSDGSHSCRNTIHELTQEDPEDPGSRRLRYAKGVLIGRLLL